MLQFLLNDQEISTPLHVGMTVLDFVRYEKSLTGTKIGCREGDCGACTILIGQLTGGKLRYSSATSCLMPLGNASQKHIVTIEGINNTDSLNAVQQAFSDEGATQCGFCTPGFIVSLTGYCINDNMPCYRSAIDAMNGNICRCTGYKSIERAAVIINDKMQERKEEDKLEYAVRNNMIPSYFLGIKEKLEILSFENVAKRKNGSLKNLGGGTDLYVQQHEAMTNSDIDFLLHKKELKGIEQHGNICEMGASVTASDIASSPVFKKHFPYLDKYIKLVSSTQIRNMATIAGNLVNASPIGDFTIFFLALDAKLLLRNGDNNRTVPLRKFYKGYKLLDKEDTETIEKISFELPGEYELFNFEKVCKRTYLDIASVNTAINLKMMEDQIVTAGLSAGGIGPVPAFLERSSLFLTGKRISAQLIADVIEVSQKEIMPISDARGTATYKRLLLSQLIKAHFIKLFPLLPLEKIVHA